jgi:hypothetical protein
MYLTRSYCFVKFLTAVAGCEDAMSDEHLVPVIVSILALLGGLSLLKWVMVELGDFWHFAKKWWEEL